MRYKKTSRRGFAKKRSRNWIDSLTFTATVGTTDRQAYTLTPTAGTNGGQAFLQLINNTTLSEEGGEDAVIARIVGDVHIIGGRKNSVATSGFLHLSVLQMDSNAITGLVEPQNMFDAFESGDDNVLYDTTIWCPPLGVAVPLIQPWPVSVHIDIGVSRKIQMERYLYFVIGSAGGAGATLIDEVTLAGALRILVKRPL